MTDEMQKKLTEGRRTEAVPTSKFTTSCLDPAQLLCELKRLTRLPSNYINNRITFDFLNLAMLLFHFIQFVHAVALISGMADHTAKFSFKLVLKY